MLLKPEVLSVLNRQIAHEASNEQIEEEGLAQDMISRAELACKCQTPNIGILSWDIELLERFNA